MSDLLEQLEVRCRRDDARMATDTFITELLWLCIIALVGLVISALVIEPQTAAALFERM